MAMEASSAQDISDLLSAIESGGTVVALIVGGVWAYFKFIKDRVYRPRLDVTIEAGTLPIEDRRQLVCRLSVKNIGTCKVKLLQEGTGLRVSSMSEFPNDFTEPDWAAEKVHEVFKQHEWIESSETIRHELIFPLANPHRPLLIEARLVCKMPRSNITIYGRKIAIREWEESESKEGDDGRPPGA